MGRLEHGMFQIVAIAGLCVLALSGPTFAELPTADDFKIGPGVDQAKSVSVVLADQSERPRTIVVPPASELLDYLKKLPKRKRQMVAREKESETDSIRGFSGIPLGGLTPTCNRAIPTRQEFLRMTKRNPADARQIAQRCNMSLKGISPLRQLPVGTRQLPIDTRQRAVGTWPR